MKLTIPTILASGWPMALQTTGSGISMTDDGGFIHCSTGTDVVRKYDASGVQTATAASGIGGTTDVIDCKYSPETGRVLAVFNGTTDTVRVYSSTTLSTVVFSYSDLVPLANPRTADFRPDGSILVADGTSNKVISIDNNGVSQGLLVSVGVDNPNSLVVLR